MGRHEAATILVKDFSSAAAGYFGGIRIPASLVAGSSLGALFTFSRRTLDDDDKSRLERVLLGSYNVFVLTAFTLALHTIVLSTAATVAMLHGRFDPMAETAYAMLRREFDYEFSVTRWSFLVALLCFILGVTNRVILEFELLQRPQRRHHLYALVCVMVSLTSNLLSYINRTLYCWDNLMQMTIHVVKLTFEKSLLEGHPLMFLSLVSAILAGIIMVKVALFGGKAVSVKSKRE